MERITYVHAMLTGDNITVVIGRGHGTYSHGYTERTYRKMSIPTMTRLCAVLEASGFPVHPLSWGWVWRRRAP